MQAFYTASVINKLALEQVKVWPVLWYCVVLVVCVGSQTYTSRHSVIVTLAAWMRILVVPSLVGSISSAGYAAQRVRLIAASMLLSVL